MIPGISISEFPDCDHPWGFDLLGKCRRCARDLSQEIDAAMEAEDKWLRDFAEQVAGTELDISCELVRPLL